MNEVFITVGASSSWTRYSNMWTEEPYVPLRQPSTWASAYLVVCFPFFLILVSRNRDSYKRSGFLGLQIVQSPGSPHTSFCLRLLI